MDNIDGKQARRTGQSSGLGELFEYVCSPFIWGISNTASGSSSNIVQSRHRLPELYIGESA